MSFIFTTLQPPHPPKKKQKNILLDFYGDNYEEQPKFMANLGRDTDRKKSGAHMLGVYVI